MQNPLTMMVWLVLGFVSSPRSETKTVVIKVII